MERDAQQVQVCATINAQAHRISMQRNKHTKRRTGLKTLAHGSVPAHKR